LSEPCPRVRAALAFLGAGDEVRASAQVHGDLQTQYGAKSDRAVLEAGLEAVFDELYARVHDGVRLDQAFFALLDRTHARLMPVIRAEHARVKAVRRAQQARAQPGASASARG
jgi:hypothetical protein